MVLPQQEGNEFLFPPASCPLSDQVHTLTPERKGARGAPTHAAAGAHGALAPVCVLVFGGEGWSSQGPWQARVAGVTSPRLEWEVRSQGEAGRGSGKGVLQGPGQLGLERAMKRWLVGGVP